MTALESDSLLSFYCCDTVLVIATACTVFLLILSCYLKGKYANRPTNPGPSQKTSTSGSTASSVRNTASDEPRRASGKRRRRENSNASPGSLHQRKPPSHQPQVPSSSAAAVAPTRANSNIKCRSSSVEVHELSPTTESGIAKMPPVHSLLSKSNEVLHPLAQSSSRPAERSLLAESTVEPSPVTVAAAPLHAPAPACPKQPVVPPPVLNANSVSEWRDATPRRRERRRSRHSSKQSETGTPVLSPKQNSPPSNGVAAHRGTPADCLEESLSANTTRLQESPSTDALPKQTLFHLDTSSEAEEKTKLGSSVVSPQIPIVSNDPDKPDPTEVQGKSSKSAKVKRKRRGATASKQDMSIQDSPSPIPPSNLILSDESSVDHQRATPDDSEFELVDLSTHQAMISSATESDPDTSLGADWSLDQPVPHTGDMHEFPYLPGTESQFAIVHPSGSDANLECGQHPLARRLLSSALNDLVDGYSISDVRDTRLSPQSSTTESTSPTETTNNPPTKPHVKRSKARKAD